MNWLERWLFPRSRFVNFIIIACFSTVFSFLLIGRQVWQADWGMIDDHEVFSFLGPHLHLSLDEIWSTLLSKTEVGSLQGRFRPTYYLFKMIETWLWGANVHLWYLTCTICFAIFLSSVWWIMLRFVGGWLSGVLTAAISLLSLWTDVWSRLGPSEIYGAACVGMMLYSTDLVLSSENRKVRNAGAVILTLATIVLIGMKETFVPLAIGPAAIFIVAGIRKKLSPILICILALLILICLGGIVFVSSKEVAAMGTDYYGKSAGLWVVLGFSVLGLFDAILRTWWLYVIPIFLFQVLDVIPRKPLVGWIADSSAAVGIYVFLVVAYAAQCGLYRFLFPHNMRYDFPAMLLVPATCCVLACEASRKLRSIFPERTIDYAQLAAAVFLIFALIIANLGKEPPLSAAVRKNIEKTNLFYNELQRAVDAAKKAPENPIILEVYNPAGFEPVFSLSTYLSALGARNRISVRLHPENKSYGTFYSGLHQELLNIQNLGTSTFTRLQDSLAKASGGCISVGIDGPPEDTCSGFRVGTL